MSERNPIFRERRHQEAQADVVRDSKQTYSQEHAKLDQHPDLETHKTATDEDFRHRMEDKLAKAQHTREDEGKS